MQTTTQRMSFEEIERLARATNRISLHISELDLPPDEARQMFAGREGWSYSETAGLHTIYTPVKPEWQTLTIETDDETQTIYMSPAEAQEINEVRAGDDDWYATIIRDGGCDYYIYRTGFAVIRRDGEVIGTGQAVAI